jgi:predicted phage terminase large subunit-like protein
LYNYIGFGVESVAYQKAFYQLLKDASAIKGSYIPVIEVVVDKDKIRNALEITPFVENGTILFNDSQQDFMAELLHFPKGSHDDMVDSFVGAIKLAIKGGSSSEIVSASSNFYQGSY